MSLFSIENIYYNTIVEAGPKKKECCKKQGHLTEDSEKGRSSKRTVVELEIQIEVTDEFQSMQMLEIGYHKSQS